MFLKELHKTRRHRKNRRRWTPRFGRLDALTNMPAQNRKALLATLFVCVLFFCTVMAHGLEGTPGADLVSPQNVAEMDLGRAALLLAREQRPGLDVDAYQRRLAAMGAELGPVLARQSNGQRRLEAMGEYLYGVQGYGAHDVLPATAFVRFDEVIDKKQWNCVGLSLLYVALGERLELPLRLVSGPGHVLVQYDEGANALYIETTQGGRVFRNKDYVLEYLPFPCLELDEFRALDKSESLSMLLLQLANVRIEGGAMGEAMTLCQRALAFNGTHGEVYYAMGLIHSRQNQPQQAMAAFDKAINLNPGLNEAYAGLANAFHAARNLPQAIRTLESATQQCPEDPVAQYNLGQILYEAGEYEHAADAFRTYTRLQPKDPDGYLRLAFVLEDMEQTAAAIAAYRTVLELAPDHRDVRYNLGLLFSQTGRFTEAAGMFQETVDRWPEDANAWGQLGATHLMLKSPESAVAALRKATALAPGDRDNWRDLGQAWLDASRPAEAVDAFKKYTAIAPNDAEGYRMLAQALEAAGDAISAAEARKRAMDLEAIQPTADDGAEKY